MDFKLQVFFLGLVVSGVAVQAKQYTYQTGDLFEAVKTSCKRDVKQYLHQGIDVNALDQTGKTALDYAVNNENKAIIKLLLKKKAKVTSECNALKCRELVARRSFWRVLLAVALGGVCISALNIVGLFGGAGLVSGMSIAGVDTIKNLCILGGIVGVVSVGYVYGTVKLCQKTAGSKESIDACNIQF